MGQSTELVDHDEEVTAFDFPQIVMDLLKHMFKIKFFDIVCTSLADVTSI